MSVFKAENIRLKKRIEELEDRLLKIVGAIKIFTGGLPGKEHEMNNHIAEIITNASELKIVAPFVTKEYVMILEDRVNNNVDVQCILNDRRLWPEEYATIYDKMKVTPRLQVINNPNVKFLLIWSPESALFTSGPLSKQSLMKTVLMGTRVNERGKIKDIMHIFKSMLPSFMQD